MPSAMTLWLVKSPWMTSRPAAGWPRPSRSAASRGAPGHADAADGGVVAGQQDADLAHRRLAVPADLAAGEVGDQFPHEAVRDRPQSAAKRRKRPRRGKADAEEPGQKACNQATSSSRRARVAAAPGTGLHRSTPRIPCQSASHAQASRAGIDAAQSPVRPPATGARGSCRRPCTDRRIRKPSGNRVCGGAGPTG
jgi:hypothetical protein